MQHSMHVARWINAIPVTIENKLAERVGFEPRLSNKINKLGGAPHSIGRLMDADFFGGQVFFFSLRVSRVSEQLLTLGEPARSRTASNNPADCLNECSDALVPTEGWSDRARSISVFHRDEYAVRETMNIL